MAFERIVIEKVSKKLPNSFPNFVCGCLFASVNEEEVGTVVKAIKEVVAPGVRVQVNGPVQDEYAFDII